MITAAMMAEYKKAQYQYFKRLAKIYESRLMQMETMLLFRPTTHKETDR